MPSEKLLLKTRCFGSAAILKPAVASLHVSSPFPDPPSSVCSRSCDGAAFSWSSDAFFLASVPKSRWEHGPWALSPSQRCTVRFNRQNASLSPRPCAAYFYFCVLFSFFISLADLTVPLLTLLSVSYQLFRKMYRHFLVQIAVFSLCVCVCVHICNLGKKQNL